MTWVKLDDGFHDHPKVLRAGAHAVGLHVISLTYCARYLTDGHVPREFVAQKVGRNSTKLAQTLVDSGLWEVNGGDGWRIHDYLSFNPSREQILERRAKDLARKVRHED